MKKILKNKFIQFGLILLLIIFLFSVLFPQTKAAGFFRNSFWYFFGGIEGFFSRQGMGAKDGYTKLSEISTVRQERDDLLAQNKNLIEENSQLKEVEYQNEVLRNQLKLIKQNISYNLVAAEIIGREVGGFSDIVIINRGKKHGLKKSQPVVSGNFLVGKIVEVHYRTAHVQFVTSADSIVNGMLQNSRKKGIIKGGLGYNLEMESIPKDTEIQQSENVITSGLGGTYPKGLIIGQVDEITSQQGDIFKKASLITPILFGQLEILFVIK